MGLLLFAQNSAAPLDGWPSIILQTGFGGLLAYVLIRLAPAMLKDSREEREVRDKLVTAKDVLVAQTVQGLVDTHAKNLTEITTQFRMVNEALAAGCDKRRADDIAAHERYVEILISAIIKSGVEGKP